MKYKVRYSRKKGIKRFLVKGEKGDELVYTEAEAIREGSLGSFVPLTYGQGRKGIRITYGAMGFIPLSECLKNRLPPRALEKMLRSMLGVLCDCEGGGLLRQRIASDPEHVLLNPANGCLRFIYVPLQSFVSTSSGMKGLLVYLCEHAQVPAGEVQLRERVLDIARRMTVVTSTDFLTQLRGLGIDAVADRKPQAGESFVIDVDQLGKRVYHGLNFVEEQRQAEEERATLEAAARAANEYAPTGHGTVAFTAWQLTRLSTGTAWELGDGVFDIGRDASASICLPDVLGMSRSHARIAVAGASCSIEDLGSTNGVRVNGVRLAPFSPAVLQQGDRIQLGSEIFRLT